MSFKYPYTLDPNLANYPRSLTHVYWLFLEAVYWVEALNLPYQVQPEFLEREEVMFGTLAMLRGLGSALNPILNPTLNPKTLNPKPNPKP